nr:hypothetical protein [Tanacetum cinerariifolium]
SALVGCDSLLQYIVSDVNHAAKESHSSQRKIVLISCFLATMLRVHMEARESIQEPQGFKDKGYCKILVNKN